MSRPAPPSNFTAGEVPGTEPPDFKKIAEQLSIGQADAGWFTQLAVALGRGIMQGVALVLGLLLKVSVEIQAFIVESIIRAEESGDPRLSRLASLAVSDLFGVDVAPDTFSGRGQKASRENTSRAIGQQILKALFGKFQGSGGATIEPDDAQAAEYLGMVTQLAMEGWFEGVLAETLSAGQLETFADLDDIMAQVFGFGRLTRRILNPALNAFIVDPFEWKINKAYRPKMLSAELAVRQILRRRGNPNTWLEELARQGYSSERIEALMNSQRKFMAESDVELLVAKGLWTDAQAIDYLGDQGWELDIARTKLQIAKIQRTDQIKQRLVTALLNARADRQIDNQDLRDALFKLGLPPDEIDLQARVTAAISELKDKDLSLAQMQDGYERGIVNLRELRDYLEEQGYGDRAQLIVELITVAQITDRTQADAARKKAAEEKAAARAAQKRDRELQAAEREEARRAERERLAEERKADRAQAEAESREREQAQATVRAADLERRETERKQAAIAGAAARQAEQQRLDEQRRTARTAADRAREAQRRQDQAEQLRREQERERQQEELERVRQANRLAIERAREKAEAEKSAARQAEQIRREQRAIADRAHQEAAARRILEERETAAAQRRREQEEQRRELTETTFLRNEQKRREEQDTRRRLREEAFQRQETRRREAIERAAAARAKK